MVEFSALSTPYVPVDAPRPSDSATAAVRITPLVQGDGLQSDSRGRSSADRATDSRFNGRVAFTAKFGPDPETGLPLQVVRGADVEAAENFDLIAVIDRRIANRLTDGSVLGVQEARDRPPAPPAETESSIDTLTIETTDTVGVSFESSGATGESGDAAPPTDFGVSRPAPSGERGAVLDISI
ncbi:MAG: hypothetical protein AB7G39_02275 [Alphaproteobacteria bacterium]